jgi:hypothetical protein
LLQRGNASIALTARVRKYPDRFAIMGWFYLDDPNGHDPSRIEKSHRGCLPWASIPWGFYFNEWHKREWMTDGSLDWLWPGENGKEKT